jgi:hypothetical protein
MTPHCRTTSELSVHILSIVQYQHHLFECQLAHGFVVVTNLHAPDFSEKAKFKINMFAAVGQVQMNVVVLEFASFDKVSNCFADHTRSAGPHTPFNN